MPAPLNNPLQTVETDGAARRDFIQWIVSAKQTETRARRIRTACDMLAKGKLRPCCFDRSGMYDKSLSCPVADDSARDSAGVE